MGMTLLDALPVLLLTIHKDKEKYARVAEKDSLIRRTQCTCADSQGKFEDIARGYTAKFSPPNPALDVFLLVEELWSRARRASYSFENEVVGIMNVLSECHNHNTTRENSSKRESLLNSRPGTLIEIITHNGRL